MPPLSSTFSPVDAPLVQSSIVIAPSSDNSNVNSEHGLKFNSAMFVSNCIYGPIRGDRLVTRPAHSWALRIGHRLPACASVFPFLEPCSFCIWNLRSLLSVAETGRISTLSYFASLVGSHTFVGLTESRTTIEKISVCTSLPRSHVHFFTHFNSHTAGVSLSISKIFLENTSCFDCCTLDDSGSSLYFWSDTPFGSLDVFVVYLDPASDLKRKAILDLIIKVQRKSAHTIIMGDFNFVIDQADRITSGALHTSSTRGRDCACWHAHFSSFKEFEQPLYTCQNT